MGQMLVQESSGVTVWYRISVNFVHVRRVAFQESVNCAPNKPVTLAIVTFTTNDVPTVAVVKIDCGGSTKTVAELLSVAEHVGKVDAE
jgi:hypothetical protein